MNLNNNMDGEVISEKISKTQTRKDSIIKVIYNAEVESRYE
jgi:hypothetical protein